MAGNFCTQCGNPIEEEGSLYCVYCGANLADPSLPGISAVAPAAGAATGPAAVAAGYTVPAEAYEPNPGAVLGRAGAGGGAGIGVVPGTLGQPSAGADRGAPTPDDGSAVKRGAIIGILAGLVVAAIIVLVVYKPFGGPLGGNELELSDTDTPTAAEGEGEAPESRDAAESDDADGTTSTTEESTDQAADTTDYYDDLKAAYDAMPGYDAQIASCADYFNYNYTNSDFGVRQAGADDALRIHDNVNADLMALRALGVPEDNPYHGDWEHMVELMEDLQHRIDVIDQAWQNSLSYSDPANHVDAIIAPLSADNVDGVNRYKAHYQANFGSWAPTKR